MRFQLSRREKSNRAAWGSFAALVFALTIPLPAKFYINGRPDWNGRSCRPWEEIKASAPPERSSDERWAAEEARYFRDAINARSRELAACYEPAPGSVLFEFQDGALTPVTVTAILVEPDDSDLLPLAGMDLSAPVQGSLMFDQAAMDEYDIRLLAMDKKALRARFNTLENLEVLEDALTLPNSPYFDPEIAQRAALAPSTEGFEKALGGRMDEERNVLDRSGRLIQAYRFSELGGALIVRPDEMYPPVYYFDGKHFVKLEGTLVVGVYASKRGPLVLTATCGTWRLELIAEGKARTLAYDSGECY